MCPNICLRDVRQITYTVSGFMRTKACWFLWIAEWRLTSRFALYVQRLKLRALYEQRRGIRYRGDPEDHKKG